MSDSKTTAELQESVEQLREWILQQPNLPDDIDNRLVTRFLHSNYYDMEKAKKNANAFFEIRTNSPDLLTDRDLDSPAFKTPLKIVNWCRYTISGNRNVWISQYNDPGLANYNHTMDAKIFFMFTDAWLLDDTELETCDIMMIDIKDVTMKSMMKSNMSIGRRLSKYQQNAFPVRTKQIHVMNAPPVIDKLYSFIKPILGQELTKMMKCHVTNSDTIYQYLSKDELPLDFGGTLPSMSELNKATMDLINRQKPFLVDNLWTANKKSKKTQNSDKDFRTLAID